MKLTTRLENLALIIQDEDGLKTVYWADWNSDQLPDVLVGIQWSGTDYWALSEYFQHTVDRDLMRNSQLDTYEDFESKSGEFMVVDWNDDGYEDIVVFEASAAVKPGGNAIVDWDKDGSLDLLISARDGKLHYYQMANGSLREEPRHAFSDIRTPKDTFSGWPVRHHLAQPVVVDFDNDGDMDLFLGPPDGRYFEQLVDGNLREWSLEQSPVRNVMKLQTYVWEADGHVYTRNYTDITWRFVDCDGDGDFDLLRVRHFYKGCEPHFYSAQQKVFAVDVAFALLCWIASAGFGFFVLTSCFGRIPIADLSAQGLSTGSLAFALRRRQGEKTPLVKRRHQFCKEWALAFKPCRRGPDRSMTAGKLQDFLQFFEAFIKERSMYYVCSNIVKPLTEPFQMSFAELVGPTKIQWFVSHYWGMPVRHFHESIRRHAQSYDRCEGDWRDSAYWICTFSNSQWHVKEELGHGHWGGRLHLADEIAGPLQLQVPRAPVKPDTLQTTLERRLRRTYRRVLELQKPSWPWRLLNKVREELRRFARIFPELTEFDVLSPRLPDILLQCIQRESDASSERRLARWHTDMNENEQALIRWVKGADKLIAPSGLDSVPVHPQLKAEHFGREWQAIWCPHSNVEPERVLPFLSWIRADEFFCPEPVFTDTSFVRLTKQASGKAAGPDGWKADQWLLLPEGFYSAFSALWRRILDIGILPSQWAQVRCVLIPKDVGFRPISIACLAWRLGISCILHQLPPWIDQWAPPELVGGLKARSSTIVHDDLHEALQESTLFGAKIDVAKCFDHVNIEQAFIVWEKFGAPAKVVNILKCFYRMQVKSFEWQGFCSRERIRCTRGILQGCPRAWTTIPKKLLQKWRYAVETTMLGYPQSGRSRYLMWACFLTPELDPEFALDSRVVFHELWRLRREAAACQSVTDISRLQFTEVEPCERSSRLLEVLQKWGWERLSKSRFRTPSGVLDLLSHGETRVTAAMKAAWKRQLWLSEPRAAEVADLNVEPVIAVHVACMKQGQKQDPLSFSIACAAGPASRKLAKRFDLNHVSCVCGADWPSCRHVTWHCPDTNLPEHTSAPANGVEERLLVRSIAPPPQPPDLLPGDARPPVEICSAFISQMALFDGMILVATDGSCKTRHSQKRAAWGIATESQVFAFPMKGCDQNIFAAETWAVFQALHAAHLTGVRVRILCDSQAVVFAAARVRRGGSLPRWASGMWRAIALLSPESVVSWVPAHGRSKDWTPPDGHSPAVWRTYNDRIDAAVQAVAQPCADSLSAWARRVDDAMVYQTISLPRSGQFEGLLLCTSTGVLQQGKAGADVAVAVAKTVAELDTRTAEATAEEDRLMIHSLIEQMPGGFDTMNSFVRDTICNALEASHLHYESTLKDLMHTLASNSSTAPAPLPTLLTSSAAYRPNKADTSPDRVCSIDPV
ncbi:LINE-1 retrotransposable element ORF2 protein (ORF2p) (Long interspersed element-1) (L1) (Retrovirus-related Pol polyprotein LINE-1) [Includes: Reverse transcriptase [Durusdinium trenchii]|uniref:LINE-1 retrotransposable element ORF2 protein (ORF2p) (Long interspersed element-1) (L1) (Retrovirus-related Pol polyprotein LINE-1) n=1 Tax=Durusdinium trenchii TaxID=1381693 RepID=A0ABP0I2B4_9DINO